MATWAHVQDPGGAVETEPSGLRPSRRLLWRVFGSALCAATLAGLAGCGSRPAHVKQPVPGEDTPIVKVRPVEPPQKTAAAPASPRPAATQSRVAGERSTFRRASRTPEPVKPAAQKTQDRPARARRLPTRRGAEEPERRVARRLAAPAAERRMARREAPEPDRREARASEGPASGAPDAPAGGSPAVLNRRGHSLLKQGRYAEAEPYLRGAVRRRPGYAYAQYNLGWSLLRQGKARAALGPLQITAAQQPGRWEPQQRLGEAYARLGDPERAAAAFARARSLRSGGRTSRTVSRRVRVASGDEEPRSRGRARARVSSRAPEREARKVVDEHYDFREPDATPRGGDPGPADGDE